MGGRRDRREGCGGDYIWRCGTRTPRARVRPVAFPAGAVSGSWLFAHARRRQARRRCAAAAAAARARILCARCVALGRARCGSGARPAARGPVLVPVRARISCDFDGCPPGLSAPCRLCQRQRGGSGTARDLRDRRVTSPSPGSIFPFVPKVGRGVIAASEYVRPHPAQQLNPGAVRCPPSFFWLRVQVHACGPSVARTHECLCAGFLLVAFIFFPSRLNNRDPAGRPNNMPVIY